MDLSGPWMNDAAPDNRYKYNGKEYNDDFGLNWMDYGARWYDGVVGRWWSGDPLVEKNSNTSSFLYAENNPLIFVDPDGMDNILYLITLNTQVNANIIADKANNFLKQIGTNTEVRVFTCDPQTFSTKDGHLDKTDGVLVLGTPDQVKDYISKNLFSIANPSDWENWTGDSSNPERAEHDGGPDGIKNVAALSTSGIKMWAKNTKADESDIGALVALHSSGHNAGIGHIGAFMYQGDMLNNLLLKGKGLSKPYGEIPNSLRSDIDSVSDLFSAEKFQSSLSIIAKKYQDRYGKNEPVQRQ